MSDTIDNHQEEEYVSLGEYLRSTREERGLEIEQIVEETRISATNIRAMENNDYASLPADAFARGHYGHYARALSLNPDEIVARFLMERRSAPGGHKNKTASHQLPPGSLSKEVSDMAAPASVSPLSSIGFILLLLFIIAGAVCWYLSINPATYLSAKLRGIQQEVQQNPSSESPDIVTTDEGAQSQLTTAADANTPSTAPLTATMYFLKAQFTKNITIEIQIDNGPAQQLSYSAGEEASYEAVERIRLTLPAANGMRLILNDLPLPLPEDNGSPTIINIPEYLLE